LESVLAVAALREEGPALGRPMVDPIQGSRTRHLKELRPGSAGRTEIRMLFAFDPTRSALLLLGGDNARSWQRWYRENIPIAEQLYLAYTTEKAEQPSCLSAPLWTGRTWSASCTLPGSPPRRSTRVRAGCSTAA
jgi:hypothetical protein